MSELFAAAHEAALEAAHESESADTALNESIVEHLEISHYISVFSNSAGRVRYVVFIIVVFSVAMLVAQWNTMPESWVNQRYSHWRTLSAEVAPMAESAADAQVAKQTDNRIQSRAELNPMIDEYVRQRIERVFFAEVPGLGVHFDVNDLGLFSGVAYILLLTLLVFCVMREYENLYLALFKVRHLHLRQGGTRGGESAANFLYHALAMGQVFSSPPTLAQWNTRGIKRVTHVVVFIVPAIVHTYIVIDNYRSIAVAESYGAASSIMVPQFILLAGVIALCGIALFYEHAANIRWRSAFYFVNPALRYVSQPSWRAWLKQPRRRISDPLQRQLSAQLLEQLTVSSEPINKPFEVDYSLPLPGTTITRDDIATMGRELEALAAKRAHSECSHFKLKAVQVLSSTLDENVWEVKARWSVHCDQAAKRPQVARSRPTPRMQKDSRTSTK